MPNCDWGRPCSCYECIAADIPKECKYCKEKPIHTIRELETDRKGMTGYVTIGYCIEHKPKEKEPEPKKRGRKKKVQA